MTDGMINDDLRPYEPGEGASQGLAPHLTDYWYIITRHLWLVALILVSAVGATW